MPLQGHIPHSMFGMFLFQYLVCFSVKYARIGKKVTQWCFYIFPYSVHQGCGRIFYSNRTRAQQFYKNHEKCHESRSKLGWKLGCLYLLYHDLNYGMLFILYPGYTKILYFYHEHAVHVELIRDCLLACLSAYI